MKITTHNTVYCPFCGEETLLDSTPCHHVQYIYGWSGVDLNGYIYINTNFFTATLKEKLSDKSYRSLFSRLSSAQLTCFLSGCFDPMDDIACIVRFCGDKADVTFSVIDGVGYSGYYVGFSDTK